jgi:hypothetical protein
MSLENHLERIDFSKSSIYWEGPSKGIFKLVSVLKVSQINSSEDENTYGLGESVLSGNMYVSDGLMKQPPYLFQIAGSNDNQTIFRTFLTEPHSKEFLPRSKKNYLTNDTRRTPPTEFRVDIKKELSELVIDFVLIEKKFYLNNFTARIQFNLNELNFSAEFPVNHINLKSENKMWQVETGPVLLPILDDTEESELEFIPCFLHFNSFEKVDIFFDYPFGKRNRNLKNGGVMQGVNCKIEMYSTLN